MQRCINERVSACGSRQSLEVIGSILGVLATSVIAAGEHSGILSDGLSSLNQLVRHFDFEEAEVAPVEMPHNFHRVGSHQTDIPDGFLPFGTMRLTREVAYSGNWSLTFELDGGSMAARVPSAVIPIMPGADYHVAARVKTDGLTHSRARLVTWLYDARGEVIPESRSTSLLVKTHGQWQIISAPVRGRSAQATDLGIELQLLQPEQFRDRADDPYAPTLADVTGQVYFDDVSVWQQPRIMVNTTQPGNVIVSPEQPQLVIEVHDVVHKHLDAHLRVYDIDGMPVYEERFPAPRSPKQRTIDMPFDRYGWYRASLDILLDGELAARRWTDLAYLPQPHRLGIGQHHQFTLTLPETWHELEATLPRLLRRIGAGTAIMPVLTRSMTEQSAHDWHQRARPSIEHLRSEHIELIFSLDSIPDELAQDLDLQSEEVLLALDRDPDIWRNYLDDLIVNYSFEVPRWQIGSSGIESVAWLDDAPTLINRTVENVRRLIPGGSVLVPSLAPFAPQRLSNHAAYHVTMPYHIRPAGVERLTEIWLDDDDRKGKPASDGDSAGLLFEIEPVPDGTYTNRQRATDLMLRVLHAWRAGARALSLKPPWRRDQANGSDVMPQEILPVWNQLIGQLRGRRMVGTLAIGRGMHCWLLAGDDRDDAALVAWQEPGTAEDGFELQLADGPVLVTDGFGNQQTVPLRGDTHAIELERMPRFIEGINLELVQFRGGFALDPDFLPVEARIHEHELVLQNPWPMPINGTIRLREMDGITFSPRAHRFSIPAEDEIRMPVEIQLARSIMAGTKRIKADVTLSADGQYELVLIKDVTVGLEHIDFAAAVSSRWNEETGEDDLVITQYITNTGSQPINLEAFMLGRGVAHERRLIAGLSPGEMAIRTFIIPDGANTLAGERIRVGVVERDGVGRLNQIVDVPSR